MAVLPQTELFSWEQIDADSDMRRLLMVLESLPDEPLMRALEDKRKGRRDDYPVRPVWNSLIAGIVLQHKTIESLRRELTRNAELRQACGFDLFRGFKAIPPSSVYTRFQQSLLEARPLVEAMFHELVETIRGYLPDLGVHRALDGKALPSFGNPTKKEKAGAPDGRRDTDADWGVKSYRGVREDGGAWEKIKRWFGFKLHLLIDSVHELPLAFSVTKASVGDSPQMPILLDPLHQQHPKIIEQDQDLGGDKGYDSKENHEVAFDEHGIRPVIDKRNDWKIEAHLPRQLHPEEVDTIFHNARGDGSFGFERHTIRGKDKMTLHVGLALTIMLAMAVGRIKANQAEKIRSLTQAA
jgi:hypothetical protein